MQIRIAAPADAEAVERVRIRGWQTACRDVFPPAELDALEIDPSRFVRPADGVTSTSAVAQGRAGAARPRGGAPGSGPPRSDALAPALP